MRFSRSGDDCAATLAYGRHMDAGSRVAAVMRIAPHVYGAAVAASRDEASALAVTNRVLIEAAREPAGAGRALDCRQLVENAIGLAVRSCPAEGFATIEQDDREAIALARLGGYSVTEIATALGTSAEDVKRRMSRGLRTVAQGMASTARPEIERSSGIEPGVSRDSGPRTPPPRHGFEPEASRAHAAHGS
jgi:Sigma-70, region 4